MHIFLSWSGERSKALAVALRDWLPLVLHYVEPWVSGADIDAGGRWAQAVAQELAVANFGIVCITPENFNAPWILFEAGALTKSLDTGKVIPLLLDLEFSDISGPLSQFQAKKVTKNGLNQIVHSIQSSAESPIPEKRAEQLFDALWPQLEAMIAGLEKNPPTQRQGGDPVGGWDFFISYTPTDRQWAEWIAWALEEDGGYRVMIQAWDFVPGTNWMLGMEAGVRDATRTIAVLSEAYLTSQYDSSEWQAAYASDPTGTHRKLLVVRVANCDRPGLLAGVVGVDLFGLKEAAAKERLLRMVSTVMSGRAKPDTPPRFPVAGVTVPDEQPVPGAHVKVVGHVFISYVREDSLKVDQLQAVLEAANVLVWRDTFDLWPGQDWRFKIRQAITDDAFVFLACFSQNSLARKRSYQNEELALAIEQLRLRPSDESWIIPVRFDDCEIPDVDIGPGRSLASIQAADLFGDRFHQSAERLTRAIVQILRR
jgi:hypothetical protein